MISRPSIRTVNHPNVLVALAAVGVIGRGGGRLGGIVHTGATRRVTRSVGERGTAICGLPARRDERRFRCYPPR